MFDTDLELEKKSNIELVFPAGQSDAPVSCGGLGCPLRVK